MIRPSGRKVVEFNSPQPGALRLLPYGDLPVIGSLFQRGHHKYNHTKPYGCCPMSPRRNYHNFEIRSLVGTTGDRMTGSDCVRRQGGTRSGAKCICGKRRTMYSAHTYIYSDYDQRQNPRYSYSPNRPINILRTVLAGWLGGCFSSFWLDFASFPPTGQLLSTSPSFANCRLSPTTQKTHRTTPYCPCRCFNHKIIVTNQSSG